MRGPEAQAPISFEVNLPSLTHLSKVQWDNWVLERLSDDEHYQDD